MSEQKRALINARPAAIQHKLDELHRLDRLLFWEIRPTMRPNRLFWESAYRYIRMRLGRYHHCPVYSQTATRRIQVYEMFQTRFGMDVAEDLFMEWEQATRDKRNTDTPLRAALVAYSNYRSLKDRAIRASLF